MTLAPTPGIDLVRSEETERAQVRFEQAVGAFTAASDEYRGLLAAVGDHPRAWVSEVLVANHAVSVGPRYSMEPAALQTLRTAARGVIDAAMSIRGEVR